MSQTALATDVHFQYPPGFRRRRGLNWGVVGLLYTSFYLCRYNFSLANKAISQEFGFSLITAGWILTSYRVGFTLFQLPGAWFGDKIGPRRALAIIVTWWSIFTSLTTLAWNAVSMVVIRFIFGVGEAGAFPIATRSLSRWMLPAERGFAQGITHAGSRLGAAITPPIVVWMILRYGWRMPFLTFAVLGLAWSAVWFFYYRDSPEQHRGGTHPDLRRVERVQVVHSARGAQAVRGVVDRGHHHLERGREIQPRQQQQEDQEQRRHEVEEDECQHPVADAVGDGAPADAHRRHGGRVDEQLQLPPGLAREQQRPEHLDAPARRAGARNDAGQEHHPVRRKHRPLRIILRHQP